MEATIVNTYQLLAEDSDLEMLKGHKEHFEDLKSKTGYLKEYEAECYQLILNRITELENESKEQKNEVQTENESSH